MSRRAALSRHVERGARLVDVLLRTGVLRTLRSRRPFSIAGVRLVAGLVDSEVEVATLVDVGANSGQFSAATLQRWPGAKVIAFEPLAEPAGRLRQAVQGTDAEIHEVAAAAADGKLTFFPHEYTLSSSALPVAPASANEIWGREMPSVEVPSQRLDTVLAGRTLSRPVLLKLDVQGYELEALRGAEELLNQVDYVLIEMAFEQTYDGQPLFSEVHEYLEHHGWRVVRPLDFRNVAGRTIEADFLYARS